MDFSIAESPTAQQQTHPFIHRRIVTTISLFVLTFAITQLALGNTTPTGDEAPQSFLPASNQSSTQSASCAIPHAGAPSCEAESNPGSSAIQPDIPYHVGNPIDVVSGNKYQREIDYRAFNSGLALVRHYNSSLSDYNLGFGPGWRHTYQVLLTKPAKNKLNIVQSDGRLIEFILTEGTDEPRVYMPHNRSDGVLTVSDKSIWYLPDGRTFKFSGSYLVELDFGDQRGGLTLNYQQRRVDTVSDSKGGVIKFIYTSKHSSLPGYGSNDSIKPVGSIEAVVLPNGESIQYRYGDNESLTVTEYPDEDSVKYGYEDPAWINHLTHRHSSLEGRSSRWAYDDQGLATSWTDNEQDNGLQIRRRENDSTGEREANIVYSDGRIKSYQWIESSVSDNNEKSNKNVVITCTNCPDYPKQAEPAASDNNKNKSAVLDEPKRLDTLSTSQSLWHSLQRNFSDKQRSGHDVFEGFWADDKQTSPIKITANRLGEVSEINIGDTSLKELAVGALSGNLGSCAFQQQSNEKSNLLTSRIHALSRGDTACIEDAVLLVHLSEQLEEHSLGFRSSASQRHYSWGGFREWLGRFQAGTLRFCTMPAGKTCDELVNDLQMAQLSQCAYGNHCNTRFTPADFSSRGIPSSSFHDRGFDAELFYDNVENMYIVAFRGTDGNVDDDWENNFNQARGIRARQYQLAVDLASEIQSVLRPGERLEFTGHSLGGGLATVAALATRRQAHIFNAAALQPASAVLYGVDTEYQNSDQYINHVHTESDALTTLQTLADDLDIRPNRWINSSIMAHEEIQSVHGRNTSIPNPETTWTNQAYENASDWIHELPPVIYHQIDAVIHSLQSLIDANCPPQNGSP